jgi:hypothetical protein
LRGAREPGFKGRGWGALFASPRVYWTIRGWARESSLWRGWLARRRFAHMSEESEYDWSDYESGPFCRHWGDPSDCPIVCLGCGHRCSHHGAEDGLSGCNDYECDCEAWSEEQEETA